VCAEAEQGSLRLRPASAIPDDVLAALRENKAEVLSLLTAALRRKGLRIVQFAVGDTEVDALLRSLISLCDQRILQPFPQASGDDVRGLGRLPYLGLRPFDA
jgi:hypothetical protein